LGRGWEGGNEMERKGKGRKERRWEGRCEITGWEERRGEGRQGDGIRRK